MLNMDDERRWSAVMENEELANFGREFIRTCCETQNQFDAWIERFDQADLKKHFKRLVQIRNHLNEAVREGREIVDTAGL
jgi:hypothetical protein